MWSHYRCRMQAGSFQSRSIENADQSYGVTYRNNPAVNFFFQVYFITQCTESFHLLFHELLLAKHCCWFFSLCHISIIWYILRKDFFFFFDPCSLLATWCTISYLCTHHVVWCQITSLLQKSGKNMSLRWWVLIFFFLVVVVLLWKLIEMLMHIVFLFKCILLLPC